VRKILADFFNLSVKDLQQVLGGKGGTARIG
jgi:hypothetical protein